MEDAKIRDFLEGQFVKSFEDRETRVYQFDKEKVQLVDKIDFNNKPTKAVRYVVRDPESALRDNWKFWDLSRMHRNVFDELRDGNNGKGWTVMEITREGLNKNTRYRVKGIR